MRSHRTLWSYAETLIMSRISRLLGYGFALVLAACGGTAQDGTSRGNSTASGGGPAGNGTGGADGGAGGADGGAGGAFGGAGGWLDCNPAVQCCHGYIPVPCETGGAPPHSDGGLGGAGGTTTIDAGPADGSACGACLASVTRVSWGMNGGLVAYEEASSLDACRSFGHDRTPVRTDPPSLTCSTEVPPCDGIVAAIDAALAAPEVDAALANHTVFGIDPRPVDGAVFRVTVGAGYFDVGSACGSGASGCLATPDAVQRLADLLQKLDDEMRVTDACRAAFGG